MRFECYTEMQAANNIEHAPDGGTDHHRVYEDVMELIESADRYGFDVFNSIDHHYFEDFGVSSNPLAMWTAAAQRTENIRFRTLLHNVGMHNPTVLAGQITAADHLTQGRLDLGVGKGHAWIFQHMSRSLDTIRPRSAEAIDVLFKALSGERFSHDGEFWQLEDTKIAPEPYQDEYRVYTGGTSDSTYELAGQEGWGIVVPPLLPYEILEEQLDIYREECAKNGHEPDICFLHAVYMAEDEETVQQEGERALHGFLEGNAYPTNDLPPEDEIRRNDFDFYLSGALEGLAAKSWDEMVDEQIVWAGTPQQIVDYVGETIERCEGLGAITILPYYGGIDYWQSEKVLQMFSEEVIPHFEHLRNDTASSATAGDEEGSEREPTAMSV